MATFQKMPLIFLYCLVLCTFACTSVEEKRVPNPEIIQEEDDPKIVQLLPGIVHVPFVNPAIPAHFKAMSPNGTPDIYDWVYWGPQETLLAYFKDPASLQEPILRVRLSLTIIQKDSRSFLGEDEFNDHLEFKKQKFRWGEHPVLAAQFKSDDKTMYLAWLGLNSPEGDALLFELLYPSKDGKPNQEALAFWKRFLTKTQALSDQEMLKAIGQDLHDGFTIVSLNGTQLKFIAEERTTDGKLRIAVTFIKGDVTFKFDEVVTGFMGLQWKRGEPLAKIYGIITAHNPDLYGTIESAQVTNILIRKLETFSPLDSQFIVHEK